MPPAPPTDRAWIGQPADVNWCEPDFQWSPWVAEPVNTLTSLPMVALGVYGLLRLRGRTDLPERRFRLVFAALAVVGAGSAAFHGTLLRWAQALDELPMVALGLMGVWIVWHRAAPRRRGVGAAALATLFLLGFAVVYLRAPAFFVPFVLTYAATVVYMVLAAVRHAWEPGAPPVSRTLLQVCFATYLGTLGLCWIPEHLVLACDHPLQVLPLHGVWHLGAGLGTYLWLVWALVDRHHARGSAVDASGWPVPFADLPTERQTL